MEAAASVRRAEANRKRAEAKRKQYEAERKQEEARLRNLEARQELEEAIWRERWCSVCNRYGDENGHCACS
jgi:hypothetical protein